MKHNLTLNASLCKFEPKQNIPDLETLTKSLDLISQLDYVFAATVPVPVLSTIICWSFFR
jgi:hypothetical protein